LCGLGLCVGMFVLASSPFWTLGLLALMGASGGAGRRD
jgi:hypothetical protein